MAQQTISLAHAIDGAGRHRTVFRVNDIDEPYMITVAWKLLRFRGYSVNCESAAEVREALEVLGDDPARYGLLEKLEAADPDFRRG